MVNNGLSYDQLRGFAVNVASKHQAKNPCEFSEVGETKQLLMQVIRYSFYSLNITLCIFNSIFVPPIPVLSIKCVPIGFPMSIFSILEK